MDKYNTFLGTMTFDYNHCFLCGEKMNKKDKKDSVEHVFPQWIQNKYNLWNQQLILPNGTTTLYSKITIPCCKKCNNEYLSKIEKEVSEAVEKGIEAVRSLDRVTLLKWLMKIFYGQCYKDLNMLMDRSDPRKGNIISKKEFVDYKFIFDYIQSVYKSIEFNTDNFSIFIFNVHEYLSCSEESFDFNHKIDFNYMDDINLRQLAIQLGDIGIVCCIEDSNAIEFNLKDMLAPYKYHKLSQFQFREIIARIFYQRYLLRGSKNYLIISSKNKMDGGNIISPQSYYHFEEFVQKDYAFILWRSLRSFNINFNQLYYEKEDAVLTFLKDDNGRFIKFDDRGKITKIDLK